MIELTRDPSIKDFDLARPVHAEDSWNLVHYEWRDCDGFAECLYERTIGKVHEEKTVTRFQPSGPWHQGQGRPRQVVDDHDDEFWDD